MYNEFDNAFSSVDTLKWLPWVGDNYLQTPQEHRLLIIGESHYLDKTQTQASIDKHDDANFTRKVIKEMAVDRNYYNRSKIFPNLHKALFRNDDFNSNIFWGHASYYNFIQRPMKSIKQRPSNQDYLNGWNSFFKVRDILNPTICLFIGSTAAYFFDESSTKINLTHDKVKREDLISGSYAKYANLNNADGNKTELIFIRHTSQMFSWEKWNKYLTRKMPKTISWFEDTLKA